MLYLKSIIQMENKNQPQYPTSLKNMTSQSTREQVQKQLEYSNYWIQQIHQDLERSQSKLERHEAVLNQIQSQGAEYSGYIDEITDTLIKGWVCNLNNLNASVYLDIYADGIITETIRADIYREDLKFSGFGDGKHSFLYHIPSHLQAKTIIVKPQNSEYELPRSIAKMSPTDVSLPSVHIDYKQILVTIYKNFLKNFLSSGAKLKIPTSAEPLVTIIVVLYNRAELTLQCLLSLFINFHIPFELILVDNASSDETHQLLERMEGVKIIRNNEDLHFLLAANQASKEAKGEYLFFLNNDAQLLPGSLDSAINTIRTSDNIGGVGGKIILLDGSLQEAGSMIWKDGTCRGYGRGDSPLAPMYMFMRDVDFCSGAFFLTRRDIFLQIGGFDEDYKPAYYEDADYCLKLWSIGKRVVYDPNAVILHYEHGGYSLNEAVPYQITNRDVFIRKHSHKLTLHLNYQESNILLGRIANKNQYRVLFIDDRVPHSFLGAGFPRAKKIMEGLLEMDCFVSFYPLLMCNESWESAYQDIPRSVEIMLDRGESYLEDFLKQRQGYYHIIIISRPWNMSKFQTILKKYPEWFEKSKIIYDAEAIMSLREIVYRQVVKKEEVSEKEIHDLISAEIGLTEGASIIVSVSEVERQKFESYGCRQVYTLGHTLPVSPTEKAFEHRSNILFIGAIHDDYGPNADSVHWFVERVFPEIKRRLNMDIQFQVVGFNNSPSVANLASDTVRILGQVEDLTDFYNQARIFVAPTRFAAGIPLKICEAALHGIPIVSTSLLAAQLGWKDGVDLLVADDSSTFAEKCAILYNDSEVWNQLRVNALARVKEECSKEKFMATLKGIIKIP